MHLIIAEKRDQAERLAAPFSIKNKGMATIDVLPCDVFPRGATFTWAAGHIVKLKDPEDYNEKWKAWKMESLPILPEVFEFKQDLRSKELFKRLKSLLNNNAYTAVINACDPGREGEAIFGYIYNLSGSKKPRYRLWTSSLTKDAVLHAFNHLLPGQAKQNLYYEAYARACADWLIGMNTTRAYTLQLQKKLKSNEVFNTGRVQTPLLSLIIKKDKDIKNFRPEPYWEIYAKFNMSEKTYTGKFFTNSSDRLSDQHKAEVLSQYCSQKPAQVTNMVKETKQIKPPLLFSLSTLQVTANKKFKFSPDETLKLAESMYLKGFISYPRTDSNHVTEHEAATFPEVLRGLYGLLEYKDYFPVPQESIKNDKRYIDASKVSDHYAIIPTITIPKPEDIDNQERQIYDLIAKSLIAAHCECARYEHTSITTVVDHKFSFYTAGKVLIKEGWKKVIGVNESEEAENLPIVSEGETGIVSSSEVKTCMTKPPARLTQGDLISLMKNAGNQLENKEMKATMNKTHGLGTEATRANIIKRLVDSNYIVVKNNLIYPAPKGCLLIDSIGKDSALSSVELTAQWEQVLHRIGNGEVTYTSFISSAKKLASKLVTDSIAEINKLSADQLIVNTHSPNIPNTKKDTEQNPDHKVIPAGKNTTTVIKEIKADPQQMNRARNPEPASTSTVVKETSAKPAATINSNSSMAKRLGACKNCGNPVIELDKFYGCSSYSQSGCDFRISKTIKGVRILSEVIEALLKNNISPLIKGFIRTSNDNQHSSYDAYLTFNADNKLCFKYPEKKSYQFPLNLLKKHDVNDSATKKLIAQMIVDLEREAEMIKLSSKVVRWFVGPKVIRFEIEPAEGLNIASYRRYKDNFQRILAADHIVVYTPLPGQKYVGIEIPNPHPYPIYLRSMLEDRAYQQANSLLTVPLGMDQRGDMIYGDISKMPHLLVGGRTGAGKSVLINVIIISILVAAGRDDVKFVFIDPKKVEFAAYSTLPHLLYPVITEAQKSVSALKQLRAEMNNRYSKFEQAGVKDITEYNEQRKRNISLERLPFIILVIDELADLMLEVASDIEKEISSISALARGAGIHMIVATQRPTREIISPVIKTNLPTTIALSVATVYDSKAIMGEGGAEKLMGEGDMFFKPASGAKVRASSAFITTSEINQIIDYIVSNN